MNRSSPVDILLKAMYNTMQKGAEHCVSLKAYAFPRAAAIELRSTLHPPMQSPKS